MYTLFFITFSFVFSLQLTNKALHCGTLQMCLKDTEADQKNIQIRLKGRGSVSDLTPRLIWKSMWMPHRYTENNNRTEVVYILGNPNKILLTSNNIANGFKNTVISPSTN